MKNFSYKNHFRAVMPFFKLYPLKQDLFYANKHKKSSLFCIFAKGMIHNYIYYEKVAFRKKIKQILKIFENYLVLYCQSKFRQPASDRSAFHRSCFRTASAVENLYFPLKISLSLAATMTHFIIKRCMTDKLLQKAGRLGWRLQIHGAAKQDTSRQGG